MGYIALGRDKRVDSLMLIKGALLDRWLDYIDPSFTGLVPAIMASVRGIYGMIVAILVTSQSMFIFRSFRAETYFYLVVVTGYSATKGFAHFFAGLCVGLSGLASGYCMGDIGDAGLKVGDGSVSATCLTCFFRPCL